MVLTKRERVFRTLELDGEPDMVPIYCSGFEPTSLIYQEYLKSKEKEESVTWVKPKSKKLKYFITEQRFWNVDMFCMDPFGSKLKYRYKKAPPEYPGCQINPISGKIYKVVKQIETGLDYSWYIDGYFTSPEIVHFYWDKYGKPSEAINDRINYSPQKWDGFVEALLPYFYPLATLPIAPHEALFEGMSITKTAYYMRRNPDFIHEIMAEYAKTNIEIVKRLGEAGVEVIFMADDLGYKGRSIFSIEKFKEFILPYYQKIYGACKKRGILIIQHSCGYIDKLLPSMVDAGLNAIEALEPAAGVDLAYLKETLGDNLCFIGGIDASDILNFGTPQDVEQDVYRCIQAASSGGGYFAGPSHNILNPPWENVLALRAALEKYRRCYS
ncbi:MAG: uroporphyrinogen decarboxylase family protein [Promethearchaeota archaeon]